MEYIYTGMVIHKAGGKIDEATVTKVLEAAGAKPDAARVKALVAAFEGVDIEKVIKEASVMQVAAAPAEAKQDKKEAKPEAKKEEKKSEEQAAAGLGALFG